MEEQNKLKSLRLRCGLTQKQLAEKVGIPYQTVQKYEKGEQAVERMTLSMAAKYAKALNIMIEDLL